MKTFDIIVIGAGLYVCGKGTSGFGTILPAIFEWQRSNTRLGDVHCASTSATSARELARKSRELETRTGVSVNLKAYPDGVPRDVNAYKEVLRSQKRLACAIVAVPDHLHYEVAKDCLEAGLHTLIVKPLTPTYSEGLDLVNLAEQHSLYGAVEFHKRWDKSNIILRDKFRSGELGAPLNCWVEYSQRRSVPIVFFKEWAARTSILQYLGVHYIDVIRFVTSASPRRVMAIGQKSEVLRHGIDAYDSIQCTIEWQMPSGECFTETILTNWIDPENSTAMSDQKIKFIGTQGRYEADQKERGIRINTGEHGVEHLNPDFCMAFGHKDGQIRWRGYGIESITTFLDDVVGLADGTKELSELSQDRPSFKESVISTMVIEAAHRSLEDGSSWQSLERLS